jgi:hypothetical protein
VVETIINHPCGNGKHTTYGDDGGMVYGIVLPTLISFIHFIDGFSLINHPFLGIPMTLETPIS